MRTPLFSACLTAFCLLAMGECVGQEVVDADVLLKNGTIVDGTGSAPFIADLAIAGDKIVAIGEFSLKSADLEIDCTGLVITPGFIDLHNHSDRQMVSAPTRANINYVIQGSTTVVTGNCGSGPVDVANYYEEIDAAGTGTNVAHLLPQGSLRSQVMGTADRDPTDDELHQMQELAAKAMKDGAWGMSTGLIYVPSSYAKTDEITAIATVIAEGDGIYVSHIRGEGTQLLASVNEALEIGRGAELPVHISHFKSSGRDAWGLVREAARMIQKERDKGRIATADQYPYIASSTSLDAILIPATARAGGRKELLARIDDPDQGKQIRERMMENLRRRNGGESIRIARYTPRQEWVGKNLAQISAAEEKDPIDIAIEICRNGGAQIVNFSMSEGDVRHIMAVPWVATASDGRAYVPGPDRPHPRSYGTFARKIGHYALHENVISIEQAVRSASGLPADILGMKDRGYLKVGKFADVVVLDPRQYIDTATFDAPHQYSRGTRYVFVNGHPAVFRGMPTGALAGKALRHAAN